MLDLFSLAFAVLLSEFWLVWRLTGSPETIEQDGKQDEQLSINQSSRLNAEPVPTWFLTGKPKPQ